MAVRLCKEQELPQFLHRREDHKGHCPTSFGFLGDINSPRSHFWLWILVYFMNSPAFMKVLLLFPWLITVEISLCPWFSEIKIRKKEQNSSKSFQFILLGCLPQQNIRSSNEMKCFIWGYVSGDKGSLGFWMTSGSQEQWDGKKGELILKLS